MGIGGALDTIEEKITQGAVGSLNAPFDLIRGLMQGILPDSSWITEFLLIAGIAVAGGVVLYIGYEKFAA